MEKEFVTYEQAVKLKELAIYAESMYVPSFSKLIIPESGEETCVFEFVNSKATKRSFDVITVGKNNVDSFVTVESNEKAYF